MSALFISHEPKPHRRRQQRSRAPNAPEPTPRTCACFFPCHPCLIDDWSFEPQQSAHFLSQASSLSPSLPLSVFCIDLSSRVSRSGSSAFAACLYPAIAHSSRRPHPSLRAPNTARPQDILIRQGGRLVCQRRDGGKRVSRTSSRLTWGPSRERQHLGPLRTCGCQVVGGGQRRRRRRRHLVQIASLRFLCLWLDSGPTQPNSGRSPRSSPRSSFPRLARLHS